MIRCILCGREMTLPELNRFSPLIPLLPICIMCLERTCDELVRRGGQPE